MLVAIRRVRVNSYDPTYLQLWQLKSGIIILMPPSNFLVRCLQYTGIAGSTECCKICEKIQDLLFGSMILILGSEFSVFHAKWNRFHGEQTNEP